MCWQTAICDIYWWCPEQFSTMDYKFSFTESIVFYFCKHKVSFIEIKEIWIVPH